MTQPNFVELEYKLKSAIAMATASPDLLSSTSYLSHMKDALARFRQANLETDAKYALWRTQRGDRMKAFRELRRESDRIAELCDEHGLDGYPQRRIVYTEEEHMAALVKEAVAFLSSHEGEWGWVDEKMAALEKQLAAADQLKADTAKTYREYTVIVKERVSGYDSCLAVLKSFLSDARRDEKAYGDLTALQVG